VAHNLNSVPGCIIVKRTSTSGTNWRVYHRELTALASLQLNVTNASAIGSTIWNDTEPTSTEFTVGDNGGVNSSGDTFVAYLFAHDAGGFGLTGTDNVISCGSTTGGSTVTLGWEPQWILWKTTGSGDWYMTDSMRQMTANGDVAGSNYWLLSNTSGSEVTTGYGLRPTATGFTTSPDWGAGSYIYIAIRRGPMKVPTDATKVFAPVTYAGNSSAQTITAGFRVDMELVGCRTGGQSWQQAFVDRLRGNGRVLSSSGTDVEQNWSANLTNEFQSNTGTNRTDAYLNFSSLTFVDWMFQRAPSFFDEVCYTGNGATQTLTHNLGVAPELMIAKKRSIDGTSNWAVYAAPLANADAYLFLNDTAAVATSSVLWNSTAPTSTVFSLGASTNINQSGQTAVAYLFATCAGVSKVGSYTGTGALQTVNCGFTAGARFVLIKRTDSTGDWFTYDSARGITSSNDPYLLLNSTAAEVTGTNYVDTDTTGFQVTAAAPAGLNANGGTYIFLAIA